MFHSSMLRSNWLGKKPVPHWYQSYGSNHGRRPQPIDREEGSSKFLQRVSPQRRSPWSKKKNLSSECKEMLLQRIKEIEAFNASKESKKYGDNNKTQKERRARCYKCKTKGHFYWNCPNKEDKKGKQKAEKMADTIKYPEKVMFPEKVHVNTGFMVNGTDFKNWDNIWFAGNTYKFHMCSTRDLFKNLTYKFETIAKEENEGKFIFSYGFGDVMMETKEVNYVIPNVHYTPEVTNNVLSIDLLEKQGYVVEISENRCNIHYMFGGKETWEAHKEIHTEVDNLKKVITEHNKYLQKYFESVEPKGKEVSLVKGLEELKWNKDDEHDYVDDEYISWNGSLYALKVNSFSRFLSFLKLIKRDSIVYKNFDTFSKKYIEMLKWFYLVYLNYDMMEEIPPVIGVMEINLLSLHKLVDSLGGYESVTIDDTWKTIAGMHGLIEESGGGAIKDCYRKFISKIQVYYETAQKPRIEERPGEVAGDSSGDAGRKDPQGAKEVEAEVRETLREMLMNKVPHFGVSLEGNSDGEEANGSTSDSNDFFVIV